MQQEYWFLEFCCSRHSFLNLNALFKLLFMPKSAYRKLWLLGAPCYIGAYYILGACYLPCARDHLLSACAINRVHDGGERSSENYGTKSTQYTLK